jgi:thioredoxin 1
MGTCSRKIRLNASNFRAEILEYEHLAIVFFEASWSGFCHVIETILESLPIEFGHELKIGVVDLESNRQLVETYGIQKIPTLLFFKKGRIVDRVTGAVSRKTMEEKVRFQQ